MIMPTSVTDTRDEKLGTDMLESMTGLVHDMYAALQDFCEHEVKGEYCPLWREDDRMCGKQCKFRDIEDKMHELGLGDMVVK